MNAGHGNEAFVAFEHVQKSYDGETLVVKDLNLKIGQGEFLTMLGPSGSGKSSLIHLLAGFEAPDEGVVRTHLPTPGPDSIPLFWAPQHDGLWPRLSVGEHIRRVSPEPRSTAPSRRESIDENTTSTPSIERLGETSKWLA